MTVVTNEAKGWKGKKNWTTSLLSVIPQLKEFQCENKLLQEAKIQVDHSGYLFLKG